MPGQGGKGLQRMGWQGGADRKATYCAEYFRDGEPDEALSPRGVLCGRGARGGG